MARNIVIEALNRTPMEEQSVELVERKGLGHPDSIADALAEEVSRALCREYLTRDGVIHHHNTDEVQVVGGLSQPAFGGGETLEPVYILLVGRAVTHINDRPLPVRRVAMHAARSYLKRNFTHLDLDYGVALDTRISRGSSDLQGVFSAGKTLANDTSFGIGYAPFSSTETLVRKVSDYLNLELKKDIPALGEDTKVMANRLGDTISLTVAAAMVDQHLAGPGDYRETMLELVRRTSDFGQQLAGDRELVVKFNTADRPDDDLYYLTVTGLSMENGDDGSVGRGNRANGLITPGRPMSMEATSGKNPVNHVGKLYNLLSNLIADDIHKVGGGDISEVTVRLLSQIGRPISEPLSADAQLLMAEGSDVEAVRQEVAGVIDDWLDRIDTVTEKVVEGKLSTF